MTDDRPSPRVLHSFPHKIGADRICLIAWHQVAGAVEAGADVTVHPGVVHKPLPSGIDVHPTLARGSMRIPYRALGGQRALHLHDRVVARRLPAVAERTDVVHTWPLGAKHTLKAAARLGIPTVLERPNAHTRFAYAVVAEECRRLNVELPPDHEHAFKPDVLAYEEEEYELADYLLCPSEFVVKTYLDLGFPAGKLLRNTYGYDPELFQPPPAPPEPDAPLTMLFVGVAAVRKGVHYALDAWLRSPASENGTFLIAGGFLPDYRERLSGQLDHPSVQVLGHRTDIPDLMRSSDLLVLPSIEEGYGLVCAEALGSDTVPLVSEACTEICRHDVNALVHSVGDVDALAEHITRLHEDRDLLARLRAGTRATAPQATWSAAGEVLAGAYRVAAGAERPAELSGKL
jgi:glycosyltransferase involved in cell wall biosynthesis